MKTQGASKQLVQGLDDKINNSSIGLVKKTTKQTNFLAKRTTNIYAQHQRRCMCDVDSLFYQVFLAYLRYVDVLVGISDETFIRRTYETNSNILLLILTIVFL
jgi:hypothetical protein